MIVQIDADPAEERSWSGDLEPDRIQIAFRTARPSNGYTANHGWTCPSRWLITMAGWTYHHDNPEEDWD